MLSAPTLLYVFVKKHLRKHGIGGRLIGAQFPDSEFVPTASWSFWCQKFNLKKRWGLKFNSLFLPVIVDKIHAEAGTIARGSREKASQAS